MPKIRELTNEERANVVELKGKGYSNRNIARLLNVHHETVRKILLKKEKYGTVANLQRSGRKRLTDAKTDRRIIRQIKINQQTTVNNLKDELQLCISATTIRRRLHDSGFWGRVARRVPCISEKNRIARLDFARLHLDSPMSYWKKVIWTDESKFECFSSKRRKTVWRKQGESYKKRLTQGSVKHSKYVMVWGSFAWSGVGNLVEINGRMDSTMYKSILSANLRSSAEKLGLEDGFVFQHDNDPKHTSKLVKAFLAEEGIEILKWPAQSPDINPIEHLWDELDRQIPQIKRKSFQEYKQALHDIWEGICPARLQKLVESIPNRLKAIIDAKGAATKY